MSTAPDTRTVATWMLIGWQRCWTVGQLFDALGHQPDWTALHDTWPMLPPFTSPKSPIRAIVAQNWPRLAESLDRGITMQAHANAAIDFLARQTASDRGRRLTGAERSQGNRARRRFEASELECAAFHTRNDTGLYGWRKCK